MGRKKTYTLEIIVLKIYFAATDSNNEIEWFKYKNGFKFREQRHAVCCIILIYRYGKFR